jgi:fucose permease
VADQQASLPGGEAPARAAAGVGVIKALTFLMFMMFAMTTDSVGVIIPEIIKTFHLSLTAAGAFHYATMSGIALAGIGLGFLADRLGRKAVIVLGLGAFALSALSFAVSDSFPVFVALLFVSGAAIGLFKTGALALIGDISTSTRGHTQTLNALEGFFGVGAIIGPAIVAQLLARGASWKWLYVIAGLMCGALILIALWVRYPKMAQLQANGADLRSAMRVAASPYAVGFSLAAVLYVGVEAAVYVWMPTYIADYHGSLALLAAYAISLFFVLRALGRFLGAWLLARLEWSAALVVCSGLILVCFLGALAGGKGAAVVLLPLSGLFMSVMYPTLNSKGISCFPKAEHGSAAGVILFFTCVGAVAAPLAMGMVSDALHDARWGFALAAGEAALLLAGLLANWAWAPTKARLSALAASEY